MFQELAPTQTPAPPAPSVTATFPNRSSPCPFSWDRGREAGVGRAFLPSSRESHSWRTGDKLPQLPAARDGTGLSKASLHGKLVCAPERQGHPQSSRIKPGRAAGSDRTQTQHFGGSRSASAGSASQERCKAPAHGSRQSARAAARYTAPAGASSAFCLLVLSSLSPLRP